MSLTSDQPRRDPTVDRILRRRRRRRILLASLALVAAVAGFVVTRPAVLRRMLEPALAKAFGGEVRLTDVHVDGFSSMRVGSMVLIAPGWHGEAGEVVRAENVLVRISPGALITGTLRIEALDFGLLRIRAAERESEPGVFNLLSLRPDAAAGDEPLKLAEVDLRRIEIEMGTVGRDGTFRAAGRRALEGDLKPDPTRADGTLFRFALKDLDGGGRLLGGTFDDRTFAFTCDLGAIELTRAAFDLAPLAVRQTAEALGLNGRVRAAHAQWSPDSPLSAEFEVEDAEITLRGFDLGDRWARVEDGKRVPSRGLPTMRLKEGRIRYQREQLSFEHLKGQLASSDDGLVPLPAELSLRVGLDPESLRAVDWRDTEARADWLKEFLRTAPFELDLSIRGFESGAKDRKAILEAPSAIAAAVEMFGATAWRLDVSAKFSRDRPQRRDDGTLAPASVRALGQAFVSEGRGAYRGFPYPLEGVQGHLTFDQNEAGEDRITIDYLKGTGPTGAAVTLRGTVEHPSPEAAVQLSLSGAKVPVDETLIHCLKGETRKALESLFPADSAAALAAADLLPKDLDALVARSRSLDADLRAADDGRRQAIAEELERTRRMMEARSFRLGGEVDVDLTIARPPGSHQRTITEGMITVRRADVMDRAVPYPLHVTGGRLKLARDGIEFMDDGLRAVTFSGAAVRVQGHIAFHQGADGLNVAPDIMIVGAGDRVTPLLLAAIPPPAGTTLTGWPGAALAPAAGMMRAARLEGDLDFRVRVNAKDGAVTAQVDVQVANGSIDVDPGDGPAFGLPATLALTDIASVLHIDGDHVHVLKLTAHTPLSGGELGAEGTIGPGKARDIQLTLTNVPLERWMPELTRESERADALRRWAELSPAGHLDAALHLERNAAGHERVDGTVTPRDLTFMLEGESVAMARAAGTLTVRTPDQAVELHADKLAFAVGPNGAEGTWTVDGDYRGGADSSVRATVAMNEARWDSPLVAGLVRRVGGAAVVDAMKNDRPEGSFGGTGHVVSRPDGSLAWDASIEPRTLTCTLGKARPALEFERGSMFTITPDAVEVKDLRAQTNGGTIAATGRAAISGPHRELSGELSVTADRWTPEITAFLPEPLGSAQRGLGFTAEHLSMPAAQIRVAWDPHRGISAPDRYEMRASLTVEGGEFTIGVPFTDVDGTGSIDFGLVRGEGEADTMTLRADLASPSLRVFDRLVTNGTATIGLADGTGSANRTLEVRGFDGAIAGGRLAGDASLALGAQTYSADVRLTDAQLAPLLAPKDPSDQRKGSVDARLTVGGTVGDISSRAGRGRVVVHDATMASSMLTLRLVELSQLALPLSSALRSADIAFFIDGPRAQFERFHLEAGGVDFDGRGFVDTRDLTIAAAFRSRGRLVLVRDLVGALTDALWEIEVTGPVTDPKAGLRPLPGLGATAADQTIDAR